MFGDMSRMKVEKVSAGARDSLSGRWRCSRADCSVEMNRSLTELIVSPSSTPLNPSELTHTSTAVGLSKITTEQISAALQVTPSNPMTGISGRASLLVRLSSVLSDPSNSSYFTSPSNPTSHRPGHLVDYLFSHPSSQQIPSPSSYNIAVKVETLWDVVVNGLSGVWPEGRSKIDGVSLGDVWPVDCLKEAGEDAHVSFHKLSQWLSYSLIEV